MEEIGASSCGGGRFAITARRRPLYSRRHRFCALEVMVNDQKPPTSLVERFIAEECNSDVRALLLDAIAKRVPTHVARFELNAFDVTIDFERNRALVVDIIGNARGEFDEQEIGLEELVELLAS